MPSTSNVHTVDLAACAGPLEFCCILLEMRGPKLHTALKVNSRFTQQRSDISYHKRQLAHKIRQPSIFRAKKHCAKECTDMSCIPPGPTTQGASPVLLQERRDTAQQGCREDKTQWEAVSPQTGAAGEHHHK